MPQSFSWYALRNWKFYGLRKKFRHAFGTICTSVKSFYALPYRTTAWTILNQKAATKKNETGHFIKSFCKVPEWTQLLVQPRPQCEASVQTTCEFDGNTRKNKNYSHPLTFHSLLLNSREGNKCQEPKSC